MGGARHIAHPTPLFGIIQAMRKIAVLMGGRSSEREVSLMSGRNVAEALASLGKYEVVPVVLDAENLDDADRIIDERKKEEYLYA